MRTATADVLPECLIHNILSFLNFKEATRMSILSKTWLQAWSTLPNLEFEVHYPRDMKIVVDNIMERYRDGKIPIEKFELSNYSVNSQVFPLTDKWLDIALQNGVKNLVLRVPEFSLPIFTILAAKSLKELVLNCCDLTLVSLSSGVVNCNSLRKLSLVFVKLDENMLQTLLKSCPMIVYFIFMYCSGLEKIELLNLQNIKSITIKACKNQLVKIQAPTLEHMSCLGLSEGLDVVECQNLKSLELLRVKISDRFSQHLTSRFQFLESLILHDVSDGGLGAFTICKSQSLKILKIRDCHSIKEIDAPNLVSLEYTGNQIPELKIARESSQLEHSKIFLQCHNYINAEWFCKLRKFLSNSTSWSQVSLDFFNCNEINIKDLQLHHRVAIPQVGVLNVNFMQEIKQCPTFIDALLWSCHPRILELQLRETVTFFIDHLMYMKNSSQSTSHGSKPWYSQLKEVKAYKFDWTNKSWHPVEHKSGELATKTRDRYYILLDW